jgi:hypothetical protein
MVKLNPFLTRWLRFGPKLAYAALVGSLFWVAAHCYLPGRGFTYLLEIGDRQDARLLPEMRAAHPFELRDSWGYDGQFYAEIAMRPHLSDPMLAPAVDNLSYRARRILLSWTAWVFAGGNPIRAANAYAVQSLVAWLLLALLLTKWFPPCGWGNFLRWACVLYSFGMCHSIRASLVDGPSLLLIAFGLALLEWKRPWMAAIVLGVSGLARETNILAGVALVPRGNSGRAWARSLAWGAVVALPITVWMWILWRWLGSTGGGTDNFSAPFSGYFGKWSDTFWDWERGRPSLTAQQNFATLAALAIQFGFFALRRRWSDSWWRVGAAYAALMALLGPSVWGGYPPAAARVLLPMTLAFNILVPRGRRWWLVLALGNLNMLASLDVLVLPNPERYLLEGPAELRYDYTSGEFVGPVFDEHWSPHGHSYFESWRWSDGPSSFAVRNPHPFALMADIEFELRSKDDRLVSMEHGGRLSWQGYLHDRIRAKVVFHGVRLEPGDTAWTFDTPMPGGQPHGNSRGPPVFSLRNLEINVLGRANP